MENGNNIAHICGTVEDSPVLSHEIYGEKFYSFTLCIPRLSEAADYIRVMMSERLAFEVNIGERVEIVGQFRSYNNYVDGVNRLVLTVFAREIYSGEGYTKNPNTLFLNGYVCKPPIYRTTPFGREICDILLAVNRTYNKSDYIPVIAWGRNARFAGSFAVGDNIKVWGRIQSRIYKKQLTEEESEIRTAYEVSVSKIEKV